MNRKVVPQILPLLVLALTGLAVAAIGSAYRIGSLTAMGPGFLPLVLGLCLALLSLCLLPGELKSPAIPAGLLLRPLLCVSAGMLAWIALVETAGFIPAGLVQLLLTSLALPQQNWRVLLIGAVLLTLAAYGVFVTGLGLPVPAFGG